MRHMAAESMSITEEENKVLQILELESFECSASHVGDARESEADGAKSIKDGFAELAAAIRLQP